MNNIFFKKGIHVLTAHFLWMTLMMFIIASIIHHNTHCHCLQNILQHAFTLEKFMFCPYFSHHCYVQKDYLLGLPLIILVLHNSYILYNSVRKGSIFCIWSYFFFQPSLSPPSIGFHICTYVFFLKPSVICLSQSHRGCHSLL